MKMYKKTNKKIFKILSYVIIFFLLFSINNLCVKASVSISTGRSNPLFSYKIERIGLYNGIKTKNLKSSKTEYYIKKNNGVKTLITLPTAISGNSYKSNVYYRVFKYTDNNKVEQLYCIEQGVGFKKGGVPMTNIQDYLFIRTTKIISSKDGTKSDLLCNNSCAKTDVEEKIECETNCRKELIAQVISVGYHNTSPDTLSEKYKNIATQELIWEIARGERTSLSFSKKKDYDYRPNKTCEKNGKYCPFYTEITKNSKKGRESILKDYKQIINKVYYTYYNTPKEFAKAKDKAKTIEFTNYKNKKFTLELNSQYYTYYKNFEFTTNDPSVTVKLNGEKLTITSTKPLDKEVLITATYKYVSKISSLKSDNSWSFASQRASGLGSLEQALATGSTKVSYYLKVKTPKYCIKIMKKGESSNTNLKGAKFSICSDSKCKNVIKSGLTTVSDGSISYENITKPGTYYVKETQAPSGYENSSDDIKEVTVADSNTEKSCKNVTFYNKKIKYQIKIKKINEKGNALEGATFSIYNDKSCKERVVNGFKNNITTDKNGIAKYEGLKETGTYYVKEVEAPENHKINTTCYKVVVKDSNKVGTSSYAEPTYDNGKKGIVNEPTERPTYKLKVKKVDYDSNNGISGVKFTIYYKNKNEDDIVGTMTTNGEGIATYKKLENIGTYYVKEDVPDDYQAVDNNGNVIGEAQFIKIEITEKNNTKTGEYAELGYSIKNKKKKYQLKIIKKDSVTGSKLSGVKFKVCYGSCNCSNPYTVITGTDGVAILNNLEKTGSYCIQEMNVLPAYQENNLTYSVTVNKTHLVSDNNDKYATITINNQPNKFTLVKKMIDSSGKLSDLNDECGTNDNTAIFQVLDKDKKIVSFKTNQNGRYNANLNLKGTTVQDLKTCDGNINIYSLEKGTYYIKEIKAPSGVQIYNKDELIKVTIPNQKQITLTNGFIGLEFQKKNEDGKLIEGGKFSLQKKINNIYKDVLLLEKENGNYQYNADLSSKDKNATYELVTVGGSFYVHDLPVGEYRVVEKEAPEGYDLIKAKDSTAIVSITDTNKDDYIIVEMINKKSSKEGSSSSAELILTIITGRKIINYVYVFGALTALIILLIYLRKKLKK